MTDQQTVLPGAQDQEPDRKDDAKIADRCQAVTADGDQCKNAVSHMTNGPFCGPHSDRTEGEEERGDDA